MIASEVQAEFHDPVASLEPAPVASHAPPPASRLPTTGEVEMRTLALLADGATAPAPLLDDRRGRLANDVWIACRRVGQTARFTCKLGAGPGLPRASLSHRWRATTAEVLTWEPTRTAG